MTTPMTPRQRIHAAIAGEPTDRQPVALWRHFPVVDVTADGLAGAVVDYQREYGFDLVKVTPASGYPAEAWGAELVDDENEQGTRRYVSRRIKDAKEWRDLRPLDSANAVHARELDAIAQVRAAVGSDVHVLETIFSPFTIAKQLYGPEIVDHARDNLRAVEQGLEIITETTARFAADALDRGADGIFFATQFARHDRMSELEYREFGLQYDLPVLDTIRDKADLLMLHLCGPSPMFHFVPKYGVNIVNWEDRETPPTLHEGWERFTDGAVLGGIRRTSLTNGTPENVEAEARWAIQHTEGGQRLILGTGCVTCVTAPEANVRAARQSAELLQQA